MQRNFTVTVLRDTVSITNKTGVTSGVHGTSLLVKAQVAGTHFGAVPDGTSVSFNLGGSTCSGTTAGGLAQCSLTLPAAGPKILTITTAVNSNFTAASTSSVFTVT